jgi:hypothetical protein
VVDYGDVLLAPLFNPRQGSSSGGGGASSGKRGARMQGSLLVLLAYALLFAFDAPVSGFAGTVIITPPPKYVVTHVSLPCRSSIIITIVTLLLTT